MVFGTKGLGGILFETTNELWQALNNFLGTYFYKAQW